MFRSSTETLKHSRDVLLSIGAVKATLGLSALQVPEPITSPRQTKQISISEMQLDAIK